MAGKLLRNLKQIGTICFVVSCFPNFSYGACTDGTYRACVVSDAWQRQKCSSNNWVDIERKDIASDEWPYACGDNYRYIPESTNGEKVWNNKAWNTDENIYAYWKTSGKSLSSDNCAEFNDICNGCARDEYYDTAKNRCEKSIYAPPCDTTQSAGDSCTFNDGAASAICKDIGFKSNDKSVLTCVAKTCEEGYLLKLSPTTNRHGQSDGRCDKIEQANKTCSAKPDDCNGEWGVKLYQNPNTNEDGKAYIPDDCECKTQSGAITPTEDSSEVAANGCSNIEENADYDSNHIRWKPYNETSSEGTMAWVSDFVSDFSDNSSDLNAGEWAVTFSFGTVKGQSLCSDTVVETEQYSVGKPNEQEKKGDYCWCRANGVNNWVLSNGEKVDSCMSLCAMNCATYVGTIKEFRNLVFGCSTSAESEQQEAPKPEQPKIDAKDEAKKREIENAKQVLSGFFASASANRNVWKNEEGKFNTARLASDLGAAVVLGTVGGVVSGTVIKKKQLKKGFESLQCYVGGKPMADWGDTFNVDLAR